MDINTLFQSISTQPLSQDAKALHGTLDTAVSIIVGRLIEARLIDYAGEPGDTIELLSQVLASALIDSLKRGDTVEIIRFLNSQSTVGEYVWKAKSRE